MKQTLESKDFIVSLETLSKLIPESNSSSARLNQSFIFNLDFVALRDNERIFKICCSFSTPKEFYSFMATLGTFLSFYHYHAPLFPFPSVQILNQKNEEVFFRAHSLKMIAKEVREIDTFMNNCSLELFAQITTSSPFIVFKNINPEPKTVPNKAVK